MTRATKDKGGAKQGFLSSPFVKEAGGLWAEATRAGFLDAISGGTLPEAAFTRWLAQDYHFARGLMAFQSLVLSRAPRPAHSTLIGGLAALDAELGWFETHAALRGVDLGKPLHPTCRHYVDFLLRCGYNEDPADLLAVLFGVEVSYLAAWSALEPAGRYAEFIERWSNPRFREYVEALQRLAEAKRGPRAQRLFNEVLEHERDFWRMTWEG